MLVSDPNTIILRECRELLYVIASERQDAYIPAVPDLIGGSNEYSEDEEDTQKAELMKGEGTEGVDDKTAVKNQLQTLIDTVLLSQTLDNIDACTIVAPFNRTLISPRLNREATIRTLDALEKFINFQVINVNMSNYSTAFRMLIDSLNNISFDAYDKTSDDSILFKTLVLLRSSITKESFEILSDSVAYDLLKTTITLACNSKRSPLLQEYARSSIYELTAIAFNKIRSLKSSDDTNNYINDKSLGSSTLKKYLANRSSSEEDSMGLKGDEYFNSTVDLIKENKYKDPNCGLPVIKRYLQLLLSLLTIDQDNKHTKQVKALGFSLIICGIEVAGKDIILFPSLFSIVADQIFEQVLYVIRTVYDKELVKVALDLFITLTINMEPYLRPQIELTFSHICDILLDKSIFTGERSKKTKSELKEIFLESISIMWKRKPSYLVDAFINYDCNLNRMDLANIISGTLCKLLTSNGNDDINTWLLSFESLEIFINFMYEMTIKNASMSTNGIKEGSDIISQKKKKIEYLSCVDRFNKKPKEGITYFHRSGFLKTLSDKDIATFLFENKGPLNKQKIGLLLCDPNEQKLLQSYMQNFDFRDFRLDEALRIMLSKFRLPGESQQIERIIEMFSEVYSSQNERKNENIQPESIDSNEADSELCVSVSNENVTCDADSAFVLSYSLIMLNTDLHNPQIKTHMSFSDYTSNLRGCYKGADFPDSFLAKLYNSIKEKEILMPEEHHGNEQLFKDDWNNLIASAFILTKPSSKIQENEERTKDFTDFIGAIFETFGFSLVSAFLSTTHANQISSNNTRLFAIIEKCGRITSIYGLSAPYNKVIDSLLKMTVLIGNLDKDLRLVENDNDDYAQIEVESSTSNEAICVSNESIAFGRDEKAQLSYITAYKLLNLEKNNIGLLPDTLETLIEVLTILYDKHIIDMSYIDNVNELMRCDILPRTPTEITIKKEALNRSLLSTFASYIKGDEGPSKEQISLSELTISLVREHNVFTALNAHPKLINSGPMKSVLSLTSNARYNSRKNYCNYNFFFLVEFLLKLCIDNSIIEECGGSMINHLENHSNTPGITTRSRYAIMIIKNLINKHLGEQDKIIIDTLTFLNSEDKDLQENDFDLFTTLINELISHSEKNLTVLNNPLFWRALSRACEYNILIETVSSILDNFVLNEDTDLTDQIMIHLLFIQTIHQSKTLTKLLENITKLPQNYSDANVPHLIELLLNNHDEPLRVQVEQCLVALTKECSSSEQPEPSNLVQKYYLPVLSRNITDENVVVSLVNIITTVSNQCTDTNSWNKEELKKIMMPFVNHE
ncbi:hypothetical protein B1J92_M08052g [Nakaseomyces glabratus]|nr:hypothetical protein B1J91_M08052g [Nakaseomyces glabratus]OXB45849.1 hypothetical protein B1J92_M08052g [Nakaseomyces glabratus]